MDDIQLSLAKSMAWETAKGHLRAVIAAEGHRRLVVRPTRETLDAAEAKFVIVKEAIEKFIREMESEGWSE